MEGVFYRFLNSISKRKVIVLASTIIGLPSLSFSSYILRAKIPIAFVDANSIANFFSAFYLSAIISIAFARVSIFFLELAYRYLLIFIVLPRRRKKARTKVMAESWAVKLGEDPSMKWREYGEMAKSLSRYERAILRSKILVENRIQNIFQGVNSYYFIIPIAMLAFSYLFVGFNIWYFSINLFLILTSLRAVALGRAEFEMQGIISTAIGQAAHEIGMRNGIDPDEEFKFDDKKDSYVEYVIESSLKTRFLAYLARLVFVLKEDYQGNSEMLKRDFGLLSFVILLSGIFLGASKYSSDISRQLQINMVEQSISCVSPLLSTANHVISYSLDADAIIVIPYEVAWYKKGKSCPSDLE